MISAPHCGATPGRPKRNLARRAVIRSVSAVVLLCLMEAAQLGAQGTTANGVLDAMAGRWTLFGPGAKAIGESEIRVALPAAVIVEQRRVTGSKPQDLWFVNLESGGWQQLFAGPTGALRVFHTESNPAEWPVVMGATVKTLDGQSTRFRMTITRVTPDEFKRVLESSRDEGRTWAIVFDYDYRRLGR